MIDTGTYFPIRLYKDYPSQPEFTFNKFECESFDHDEYFWSPTDRVLPFQFPEGIATDFFFLQDLCSGQEHAVTLTWHTDTVGENMFTSYPGTDISDVPAGLYRIKTAGEEGYYYSDPFFMGDTDDKIHLKYRDTGVKGSFYWREGLFAECYIDSVIQKPTYPVSEETEEDQAGDQHRMFQRWEKRHAITFLGIESMADAMSVLPVMDEVYINDIRVYDVRVDVAWEEEYDCLAKIEISFLTRKITKAF